jgi:Fic family protein
MQKTAKAAKSDAKIKSALEYMIDKYNTSTYTPWKSYEITKKFEIGGVFPSALKELGAIKTEFGTVKLTDKMLSLRPSTVRRRMNQIANEGYARKRQKKATNKPSASNTETEHFTTDYVVKLVRTSIREELKTLFARLSS